MHSFDCMPFNCVCDRVIVWQAATFRFSRFCEHIFGSQLLQYKFLGKQSSFIVYLHHPLSKIKD